MIISELDYLDGIAEPAITGGGKSTSLSVRSINGKIKATSTGCHLKKRVLKKGSTTTTTFTCGDSRAVFTQGKFNTSKSVKTISKLVSNIKSTFDIW